MIQDELSSIKKQLAQGFSPDDAYPLGPPLFMETPRSCSPVAQIEFPDFDEVNFFITVYISGFENSVSLVL
jgi:hypothetical protein